MKKISALMMAVIVVMAMASCNKDSNGDCDPAAKWVDLGLPSGLLWATCNLGSDTPEGYGSYYAWGETATKDVYDWSTYRHCTVDAEDSLQTLTKYNTSESYGTVDNLTTLQAMDDAATTTLGNDARIPTKEEWEELLENTTTEWTVQNGVSGYKLTAANGNSLFLPAAGSYNDTELVVPGEYGFYWSASLYTESPDDAWSFSFYSENNRMGSFGYRADGQPVRPVRSSAKNNNK